MLELDHLVIGAATLDARWLSRTLGVRVEAGGRHERFGTHNALVSLGPTAYLELLAVDPDAPAPGRPRWFGLDALDLSGGPRLIHWVARTPGDLAGPDVLELERGANRWRLTVPADGALPGGGVRPSLIEWLTPPPSTVLPDRGVRLRELTLHTPDPDGLTAWLSERGFGDPRVRVAAASEPRVAAVLTTPLGPVSL